MRGVAFALQFPPVCLRSPSRLVHSVVDNRKMNIFHKLNLTPILPAWRRDRQGTDYCDMLRTAGAIPGVLHGVDEKGRNTSINIAMPTNEVYRYLMHLRMSFECTLFHLWLDGRKHLVLPSNLYIHPVSELPVSLNFLHHVPSRGSRVRIPINYYNTEKNLDMKQYGYIQEIERCIECNAFGETIPATVNCDISKFPLGSRVYARDLELPDNIQLIDTFSKRMVSICKIHIPRYKRATDTSTDPENSTPPPPSAATAAVTATTGAKGGATKPAAGAQGASGGSATPGPSGGSEKGAAGSSKQAALKKK